MRARSESAAGPQLDQVMRRFPLVQRPKPACRTLRDRVASVRRLTNLAARRDEDALLRSAEAHNFAALILSDCGIAEEARNLCWRQAAIFLAARRPLGAPMAKLALQPLVNLGRLLLREGDGDASHDVLNALFEAIKTGACTEIEGRPIDLAELAGTAEEHRQVVQWLWTVLLTDGTRALVRAARWADALRYVQRHHGIGDRLLDGRQIAVLAHCAAGDLVAATRILADAPTATPWEDAVATCLKVICDRLEDRPSGPDAALLTSRYLGLDPTTEHVVFHTRLGLSVIDLAGDRADVAYLARAIARQAADASDAYAARDVLTHQKCRSNASAETVQVLGDLVRLSGLSSGSMPGGVREELAELVAINEVRLADALADRVYRGQAPT